MSRPGMDTAKMWGQVRKTETCWIWQGNLNANGYGRYGKGRRLVHRLVYELVVGPIPDGLVLDHLCRVRHCCNPDHLEPVTSAENTLRGLAPKIINSQAEVCMAGHPRTPENLYRHPKSGQSDCRPCARERDRKRRAQLRADFAAGLIQAPHGARNTYDRFGCRCRPCTEANTIHVRRKVAA